MKQGCQILILNFSITGFLWRGRHNRNSTRKLSQASQLLILQRMTSQYSKLCLNSSEAELGSFTSER